MWWGARKNSHHQHIFVFFQSPLGVFWLRCIQTTGTVFLATPTSTWAIFFYQVQKYSKLLTNGPSTCGDITQINDFEKSENHKKLDLHCKFSENTKIRKFWVFENLQCKCSYKRFSGFPKSLFSMMSPHVEGPISTGS